MQTKIIFISDKFERFQSLLRQKSFSEYSIDLMSHAEANRKCIFQTFYNLFIVDLIEPWLALPPWIREQGQHQYFFQFIFISDTPLNAELVNLLHHRIFKVVNRRSSIESLPKVIQKAHGYSDQRLYKHEKPYQSENSYISGLLGSHPSIEKINEFIEIVSKARYAPCLIRGESGTGKNYCARLIHRANDLREDLFFVKNCENATTNELIGDLFGVEQENDLYGYKRKSLLEQYSGGTLVLKNIEKLPLDVQSKLLLYLENRTFKPFGAKHIVEANIRLIGATQHNLEWFVKRQSFNPGLFYHLNAFEIYLYPLRERGEDINLLSLYYLQHYNNQYGKGVKSISSGAQQLLKEYKWPGNIKELKNVFERAVLVCNSDQITIYELPASIRIGKTITREEEYIGNCTIREIERIHIKRVLLKTKGNKSKAALILDISRTTLREKMRQYAINN